MLLLDDTDDSDNGLDILQLANMDHNMGVLIMQGQDQHLAGHQFLAAKKSASSYAPE